MRVTESGDFRITEANDFRVLQNFVELITDLIADYTITGSSTVLADIYSYANEVAAIIGQSTPIHSLAGVESLLATVIGQSTRQSTDI